MGALTAGKMAEEEVLALTSEQEEVLALASEEKEVLGLGKVSEVVVAELEKLVAFCQGS